MIHKLKLQVDTVGYGSSQVQIRNISTIICLKSQENYNTVIILLCRLLLFLRLLYSSIDPIKATSKSDQYRGQPNF
jgi:hypothetical protein